MNRNSQVLVLVVCLVLAAMPIFSHAQAATTATTTTTTTTPQPPAPSPIGGNLLGNTCQCLLAAVPTAHCVLGFAQRVIVVSAHVSVSTRLSLTLLVDQILFTNVDLNVDVGQTIMVSTPICSAGLTVGQNYVLRLVVGITNRLTLLPCDLAALVNSLQIDELTCGLLDTVGGVVDTATNTAGGVVDTATNTAGGVVGAATNTAGGVLGAATNTAGGVLGGAAGGLVPPLPLVPSTNGGK